MLKLMPKNNLQLDLLRTADVRIQLLQRPLYVSGRAETMW